MKCHESMYAQYCPVMSVNLHYASGVATPGPTRALAQASTHLALASKTDKNHVIIY